MRTGVLLLLAAILVLPAWGTGAGAATTSAAAEPAKMFAGGGTLLSNGIFFPGTGVFDGTTLQGLPLQIEQGQDLELTNLDYGDLANCHQLRSYKRKRGRPVFISQRLCSPGETGLILTSVLKPGRYEAFGTAHLSMFAIIEVTE